MVFLLIFSTLFIGYTSISFLCPKANWYEKIGASFLIGTGFVSFLMFLFTLIGVKITFLSVFLSSLGLGSLFVFMSRKRLKESFSGHDWHFQPKNISWWIILFCIVYVVYGVHIKNMYYPTTEIDSVNGYDFMAKMIAHEGTLIVSLYKELSLPALNRFVYPPLVATSNALAYLGGADTSKIITSLFYWSLLIWFYGIICRVQGSFMAAFATLFVVFCPEMLAHASLSVTNMPQASFTAGAFLSLFVFLKNNEYGFLYLSILFGIFNQWTRTDGIVLNLVILSGIALAAWKARKPMPYLLGLSMFLPFLIWNMYLKSLFNETSSSFIRKELFWEPGTLKIIFGFAWENMVVNSQFYGITFLLFLIATITSLFQLKKGEKEYLIVLLLCVSAWFFYSLLYYFLDYSRENITVYLGSSYKRGLFAILPLAWYTISQSFWVNKLIKWVESKLYS